MGLRMPHGPHTEEDVALWVALGRVGAMWDAGGGQGPDPARTGPPAARGGGSSQGTSRRAPGPCPTMRRAAGLSLDAAKRNSRRVHPGDPCHPKTAGSQWLSPPALPESRGCRAPPAHTRHVTFKVPPQTPPVRVPHTKEGEKPGARSVPPALAPWAHAVPDYVVKYPAIRSPQQREGYKGVFQDQLAEYKELLGDIHTTWRRRWDPEVTMGRWPRHTSRTCSGGSPGHRGTPVPGSSQQDLTFLRKQQRCEYLKKKLTHIKAQIQEYDRDARDGTVYF
ncbi:occludin/ELL domain-containing protein 1 [Caloenas nicobarica]|uniref:occludin/ELL domain-containing protein 1 n=1 Tax=Caloenas nicobarica TaxID=187106 RepID=UPI0032B825C2